MPLKIKKIFSFKDAFARYFDFGFEISEALHPKTAAQIKND